VPQLSHQAKKILETQLKEKSLLLIFQAIRQSKSKQKE